MQFLLMIAQAAPQWTEFVEPEPQETNWGVLIFTLIGSIAVQALFGWWAVMKADEHDSNKVAAFFAGFLFLYAGVRMAPILRYDRIFNTPRPRQPLAPRVNPATPPAFGQGPPGPDIATAAPPAQPVRSDSCPACGAPRREGRKTCMSCGAPLPAG